MSPCWLAAPSPPAPSARPAPDSRWPSSRPSSAKWSRHWSPPPRRWVDGAAIAPSWSTARRSPCPTLPRCRPTSASPATRPKAAASRWLTSWPCSTPAPGCSWRFSPGRAHARPGQKRAPKGMPRSRWVSACGLMDQVVEYFKPVRRPEWMSEDEYRKLPESIMVRELRYRITAPGFRTREVTLVTTLLDAEAYPADALAELYGTRWRIEENLKSLKQTMKMDVLRCMTVDGVLKELTMYALAYNL